MMVGGSHVIGKTVFVIDVPSRQLSDLVFSVVSRVFHELLPVPLSVALDEMHTENVHLRIDRLVVDLGGLSRYDLENNLTDILLKALKEQLGTQLLKDSWQRSLSDSANIGYFLRYYFSTGRYPWWASRLMVAKSPAEWLSEYIRNHDAEGQVLLRALLKDPVSSKRLTLQANAGSLNIPEVMALSPDLYSSSGYSVSENSREEWLWYFIELGRFPTGATPLSVRQVFESLLQFVRAQPDITLSRMREIVRRRPWALSRLAYLADDAILRELASLWSGIQAEDLAMVQSGRDESGKEIWKEVLFQLISEPESVRGRMQELLSDMVEKLLPELPEGPLTESVTPAETMWYFLEAGSLADGLPAASAVEFLKLMKDEFRKAPLLSVARLREIVRRRSWSLSVLTRLADVELLRLVFISATGFSLAETEKMWASWYVHKSLEKEIWSELLRVILSVPSAKRLWIKELLPDVVLPQTESEPAITVKPDETVWYFLETGRVPKNKSVSLQHKIHFLKQAERQPVIFISRLRELSGSVTSALDRLVRLYAHRDLVFLIAAMSGLDKKLVTRRVKELSAGLSPGAFVRELLEWMLILPSSHDSRLREMLSAPEMEVRVPGEAGGNLIYTPEEYIWYYLETGKYPADFRRIPGGIPPADVMMKLAAQKPVLVLSRLQEIVGRRPEIFVRLMNIYDTEQLLHLIRLLSGSPLSSLTYTGEMDRLIFREILEAALRWMLSIKVSERKRLETELPSIIRNRQPGQVSNIASDFTEEDLIWHYIEFGLIPVVAPDLTQERLLEVFLNLASKYPVLVLSRLREIFKRRPWILSRLSLQCSTGYLAQLLFALSGINMKSYVESETDLSFQDQWMEYLVWILENQFSDREEILRSLPVPVTSRYEEEGMMSLEELLWYYLENWHLPDRYQTNKAVREDELLNLLVEMSGRYPVHVRARLREMAFLFTSFISGLADRLNSRDLLHLISRLSGLSSGELSAITDQEQLSPEFRFSSREFRIAILHQFIRNEYSPEYIAAYSDDLLNTLRNKLVLKPVLADAAFWWQTETGRLTELTEERLAVLFQSAELHPEPTIFRLSHLVSLRPAALSALVFRLDEAGMIKLLTLLTGVDTRLLELYQATLQRYGIPARPALEEILREIITHPDSGRLHLAELLGETENGSVLVSMRMPDVRRNDLLWYFVEHGSFPEGTVGLSVTDAGYYLAEDAGNLPLNTLFKLKDLARRDVQKLSSFFNSIPIDILEKIISGLSGTDPQKLRDRVKEISGTDWPANIVKDIWIQALKWLIASSVSRRTDLADSLPGILDKWLPFVRKEILTPDIPENEHRIIWDYLCTGSLAAGEVMPDSAVVNRVVAREVIEKPGYLLLKLARLQQVDQTFAARFTRFLNQQTLISIARNLFGISGQLLDEMRATLLSGTSLDLSWSETLRWIVCDLVAGTVKSKKNTAGKGGKWSDQLVIWYLLEYGVYPPGQKLSGRYPPALLMRNIVAENPVLARNRLAELYRSGSDLITTLNRILSVDEMLVLVRDLQELNESEWTLLESTKAMPLEQEDYRYRLSVILRSVLSGTSVQIEQIFNLLQMPPLIGISNMIQQQYHDPEDLLWYYLEHGIFVTGALESADMVALLTGALRVRGWTVRERLKKTAQKNRELPSLISRMLRRTDFAYFLAAWFESDWAQWEKILKDTGFSQERFLFSISYLLRAAEVKPEAFIFATVTGVNVPDRDADAIWHYLETGIVSSGWKDFTGTDALEILINDTADGKKLLHQIRKSYSRSRATLARLMQLLNQEGVYKLVGKLTGVLPERWTELDDLLEEYGPDRARADLVLFMLLKNIITQTWTDKNTVVSQIRRELEAGGISGTSEGAQDVAASTGISSISQQQYHNPEDLLWYYLEYGVFMSGALESADMVALLTGALRDRGRTVRERLKKAAQKNRELPSLISRMLRRTDFAYFLAAWFESDWTQWEKILKDTGFSQERFLFSISYLLRAAEVKPEAFIYATVSAVNVSDRDTDAFWHYLETGIVSAGWKDFTGTDALEILISDTTDGKKLLHQIRKSYSRSRATLERLLQLLNQEGLYKLVGKLIGHLPERWSELDDLLEEFGPDRGRADLVPLLLLKNIITQTWTDKNTVISQIRRELEAGGISDASGGEQRIVAETRIWTWLESGRFDEGLFQVTNAERGLYVNDILTSGRELMLGRLREMYSARPGFMARFAALFRLDGQRRFIARILGLDLAAWQILEEHMAGEVKLKAEDILSASLRYVMRSGSISGEELLSGLIQELELFAASPETAESGRLDEYFWSYLEFGSYPVTVKPISRREGSQLVDQWLQSGNNYVIRRLIAVFRKENAVVLRLAAITGTDTRRRLISAVLGTELAAVKQAERIRFRSAGNISPEDMLAAMLRLVLSGNVTSIDALKLALEYESGQRVSRLAELNSDSEKEYVLWYFLEQGRYPSGVSPVNSQQLAAMLLNQLAMNNSGTVLRLRELFRYHPALLVHLSKIFDIYQLRQLVASVAGAVLNDWVVWEDIIRSGTVAVHSPVRFQTAALGFLLSGAATDISTLVSLMSAHIGLEEPESPVLPDRYDAEYSVWFFLEYGHHPSGTSALSPDQFYSVLRAASSDNPARVAKRLRHIYIRTPEIILRMSRIFDSVRLQALLSVWLNLGPSDWKEAKRLFNMTGKVMTADYRNPDVMILKWWLAGEIGDAESMLSILHDFLPSSGAKTEISVSTREPQQMVMWFYLEHGRFPAGSAKLTEEELVSMIFSAIEYDREDTLYRFRDLYRRNPAFLLRINRPGTEIVSSIIGRLLDISDEKLSSVISYLKDEGGPDKPDAELVLYALLRMVMSGEIENKSDIDRLTDRKYAGQPSRVADISPVYQLWYYLDQGKRLAGSIPLNQMATILLESSVTNRAATVRQLNDLNSHSPGLFVRLVGLLSPANLKTLVFTLLNLDENKWRQLVQLPVLKTDVPDDNRLLTDLLRATLQGRLDEKSDIVEYLRQLPEYAPVDQYAPADQYSHEALMWYYLDSGRYPPGVLPLSDEELSGIMLQIAAKNSKDTRLRLHELYKRRSGLLLKLSGILNERARRSLVARLTNLTDTEWSKIEDVLRVNTGQLTGKIVNDTLRYLLSDTFEINAELLQALTGFIGRQPLPDSARPSEDDYLWYFLENGRLFDVHSPDIQQLGERLILLWRLSPGRTAAHWKTVAAKTDLNNRLRQYYNRMLLEQIIRARYESTQVDLDLMAVDLLIFSPPGRRKISVVRIWDFMVSVLLPQLHLVKHPYFIFEELLVLLSQHYHVDQAAMAHFLTQHPQVSQAGRKYALRASGVVTQSELVLLTGAIESRSGHAPDESAFSDNSYLALVASELRSVQELFSGALRWSDLPDASGTIAWLLKVAEKPVLQVVKTLLRDEWVVSRVIKNIPLEIAEIIQEALATDKWHEFLSVRDEAVYYFDLILQEHLIGHFNEAFFRISAGTDSVPSLEKTVELFLNRIVLHEHVTMSDLSGALKGKNTIGQGVLFRYIQKKYSRKESSVKPVLELVREASARVDDAVYVFNAGLVILHPYLSRYFDVLGLMEGKEFRDEESADRAVHLLQYLATRQTETPEYMLVLNKILCGLPVDMPVTPGIIMTDNEVEVSESLLRGVLQNWKRMENSSIDNLSGAFLVREGRLIEKEDRWSLHVKSRAYDILLEFMPWGFSRIKLSWMPKRLDVEWKTKA